MQAANLRGFRASVDPRFEAGIPDFSIHFKFNVVHRKIEWRNPKMKSLNSMRDILAIVVNIAVHRCIDYCTCIPSISSENVTFIIQNNSIVQIIFQLLGNILVYNHQGSHQKNFTAWR